MPAPRETTAVDPCLRPSFFLDFDNPSVTEFARAAAGDAQDPVGQAVRVFLAVRDGVRYDPYQVAFDPAWFRASATLARGAAFCVPKAILLAAALRALGIPARLGFADVTNHLATRRLLDLLGTSVFAFHGYAEVRLDGRWLKATPAFNASLCERFGVAPLSFDGRSDAVLQAFDGRGHRFMEYLRDRGHHDDFPFDEMVRVWREHYPHLEQALAGGGLARRDFEAEATAEIVPEGRKRAERE